MTNKECWSLIKAIGWGTKTVNYDEVREVLADILTKEDAAYFYNMVSDKANKIDEAVSQWEAQIETGIGLGDDSRGDLCVHIVGLGKTEYDAAIKNPKRIHRKAMLGDFVESFIYAIPTDEDYISTTI